MIRKLPKSGDRRTKTKFALFPIFTYREVAWLQKVTIQQYYNGEEWLNEVFHKEENK